MCIVIIISQIKFVFHISAAKKEKEKKEKKQKP